MNKPKYKNKVQCRICGTILESKHRHDFQACEHIFTDGGSGGYIRRGLLKEEATFDDIIVIKEKLED